MPPAIRYVGVADPYLAGDVDARRRRTRDAGRRVVQYFGSYVVYTS